MEALLAALALAGALALLARGTKTALRLALRAAEVTSAAGLAEVSARRGDLTTLHERREVEARARRLRRQDLLLLLLWIGWGLAPPLAGWLPEGYAAAAVLWLLPSPRIRPSLPVRRGS